MQILSDEELELRKKEARKREIRQNVKRHCSNIRDGIRKNGSTSGNRAIWELFQNAGDLVSGGGAEIKITLTDDAFVFAHKGKPFTYDSLCSLVKQVSSQEKETDETVGQYGTGFLTTHKFSRKITLNGSMRISDFPAAYVDLVDFVIDRDNFDDIPQFIEDMTSQIETVGTLMDKEQKREAREWTELSYALNEERLAIVQTAIDEAVRLMPYVLTFNDNIGCCRIFDQTRSRNYTFTKADKECATEGLYCKSILIQENGNEPKPFYCYYLELHGGDSRIILPLKNETEVCSLRNVPKLFVHFPLIGPEYFGVNFLFHSHRFTPEEPRDNIIVPKDNDATAKTATANKSILDEMTALLWLYLEKNVHKWVDTIKMASINIKDSGHSEVLTEAYYKALKESWVEEFSKLKIIEINGTRYSMDEENHPVVLEPALEAFISEKEDTDYLSVIYPYASGSANVPCKDELILWSQIVARWDVMRYENLLTLEAIVAYVSENRGEQLLKMLKMMVDAGHLEFFDKYALLPNREGTLMKRGELRNAKSITKDLYELVKSLDLKICTKMVDEQYADIIELTSYSRQDLRDELNSLVKNEEDKNWKGSDGPKAYSGDFEKRLIALCSSFTTVDGDSKRNKLMPIICRFEGLEYKERHISAWVDELPSFDLYRQIFLSLVENQMMKIAQQHNNNVWVKKYIDDLLIFVNVARGDDYKNFCVRYAIYPDMNGCLHVPENLKKNNNVKEPLFDFYAQVIGADLKGKCVDERFELFYEKFAEEAYQFTPKSVAKEIHNKLSADNYKDTVLLDIIDLTEKETTEGLQWRSLFKDIYDQRESIRYNLGSVEERKAINKMLKQKNPELIQKMAEVSERKDAAEVIESLYSVINQMEHNEYIKKLGDYAESHIQRYLTGALESIGVTVDNEQGGQDFILSKDGYEEYRVEVKSRWENDQSVEMSTMQFKRAVEIPERYALISLNMYNFDKTKAEKNEPVDLSEIHSNIKVLDNIGSLNADLQKRVDEAFRGEETDIRLNGSYTVRVPQNVFDSYPLNFTDFIQKLETYFTSLVSRKNWDELIINQSLNTIDKQ